MPHGMQTNAGCLVAKSGITAAIGFGVGTFLLTKTDKWSSRRRIFSGGGRSSSVSLITRIGWSFSVRISCKSSSLSTTRSSKHSAAFTRHLISLASGWSAGSDASVTFSRNFGTQTSVFVAFEYESALSEAAGEIFGVSMTVVLQFDAGREATSTESGVVTLSSISVSFVESSCCCVAIIPSPLATLSSPIPSELSIWSVNESKKREKQKWLLMGIFLWVCERRIENARGFPLAYSFSYRQHWIF